MMCLPISPFPIILSSLVFDQNHTTVWGSWYDIPSGKWGYACCHSTIPNTYCTGRAGIEASKAGNAFDASNDKGKGKEINQKASTDEGKAKEIESSGGKKRTADGKEKREKSVDFSDGEGSEASSSGSDSSGSDSDSGSASSRSSGRRRSRKSKSKAKKSHSKSKSKAKSKRSKKSPVPEWALEAAEVSRRAEARIGKGRSGESKVEDNSQVTEQQMEEYRKQNPEKNYDDPMSGYVDEEDLKK